MTAPTSLDLVRGLHAKGIITKEAASRVINKRERLLKQAMATEAAALFKNAGAWDAARKVVSSLGRAHDAEAVAAKGGGLLGKFRHGGLTPAPDLAKQTGWSDVGANIAKLLALAGLTAGASAGMSGIMRHRRDKRLQDDIEAARAQMLIEFPRINEMDPHKVNAHFSVLERYAPSLAADPIVAGTFIQTSVAGEGIDAQTIKTLADTQRHIDEIHDQHSVSSHMDRGLAVAQRAVNPFGGGGKPGAP